MKAGWLADWLPAMAKLVLGKGADRYVVIEKIFKAPVRPIRPDLLEARYILCSMSMSCM